MVNNMGKKTEERKDENKQRKGISQTGARITVSTNPSLWWEERKKIGQPNPEDQERGYREKQEKYEQERQRGMQETVKQGHEERYKPEKQMRVEGEEKKDISQTKARKTVSTTPSSWREERKGIGQPNPQDQERGYREKQEKYEQERQRGMQETARQGHEERYKPEKQMRVEGEEKKDISQTKARKTVSTTPSSWWEERKGIGQPNPQDQERGYREKQEKYEQERQRGMQETVRQGHEERYKPEKQMRAEGEEKKDISQIMFGSYTAVSSMWQDSCLKLYKTWFESTNTLLEKAYLLSKDTTPEQYKEFYTLWMDAYHETYGNLFVQSMPPSKEVLEYFFQSANRNLNLYKSWISTFEKLSQKAKELSKQTADTDANKEFYDLWAKTYVKAFDNFFVNRPIARPFEEFLEPVKNATRLYADTFTILSKMWMKSYSCSTGAYMNK